MMTENAYLIALMPLLSFVMILFFRRWSGKAASGCSLAAILFSWLMSVTVLIETISRDGVAYESFYEFLRLSNFSLEIGILVDPLTAIMLVVVTTVGACVQIYSLAYMKDDPGFSRFFAYLSLFLFSMLGLALANNYFMMFIFWQLVGLTSYLLIGFWFEKKSAAEACGKAFITTRIGDLGFLLGLLLLAFYAGTLNYGGVFEAASSGAIPITVMTLTAVAIFCGAIGKSAQFPLHVWLPDATEGPIPASALIHAATVVIAGVYLVARSMSLFVGSAEASMIVAVIGLITSLLAASIAITQNDIKRILAYSTVSQVGYMIMALGLYGYDTANGLHSPGYFAGTFHLMTHAFFMGLLFLGAGSIIHAVHSNDIRDMGGLLPKLKITAPTFMIASLSIAGIFPLSGFWSNNVIIASTSGHPIFFTFTLLTAFMTAFYMWRLCFIVFFGTPGDERRFEHAHESPRVMTWPLAFLAVLSVCAGWVGIPWLSHGFASFTWYGEPYQPHASFILMSISTIVAAGGIWLAYLIYYKKSISADRLAARFSLLHKLSFNKFYFDELYQAAIINPVLAFGRWIWKFDSGVVDGAVNGSAWIVRTTGEALRKLQSGVMQSYVMSILLLTVLFGLWKYEFTFITDDWPTLTFIFVLGLLALAVMGRMVAKENQREAEADSEN